MKRKKWSEAEEETLITHYSHLQLSKTLHKLKTREKKYQPIANHINSLHHHQDPIAFPFCWSWRDVSIKVQNMRHQYIGVKQKIRVLTNGTNDDGTGDVQYNWLDGVDHWVNFDKYKEVFGDVDIRDLDDEEELGEDGDEGGEDGEGTGFVGFKGKRMKRNGGMGFVGKQVLELREVLGSREERRREREFRLEEEAARKEERREEKEEWWSERMETREIDLEDRLEMWEMSRVREVERRRRVEGYMEEERRMWMMRREEKREEEEMEWRERVLRLQMEQEKRMMEMHVEVCRNQMQIVSVLGRLVCQFVGGGEDDLGDLSMQNMHHSGGLGSQNGKMDSNGNSQFM